MKFRRSGKSDTPSSGLPETAANDNAELEAAMRAMADASDDGAVPALFATLARSTLLVPLRVVDGEPTDATLMLEGKDGAPGLPAFTNWDALARWFESPGPYARLAAQVVAHMALAGGAAMVLNPADAFGAQFDQHYLEALLAEPVIEPAGTSFRVANTPPSIPQTTVSSLEDFLRGAPDVHAIWLFTGAYGDDEDGLFLGVEHEPGTADRDEAMRSLAAVLGTALPDGVNALMMPLDEEDLEFVRHAAVEVSVR